MQNVIIINKFGGNVPGVTSMPLETVRYDIIFAITMDKIITNMSLIFSNFSCCMQQSLLLPNKEQQKYIDT